MGNSIFIADESKVSESLDYYENDDDENVETGLASSLEETIFNMECEKLYGFVKRIKNHNAPDCGSGQLNGMGGIPTPAGLKKILFYLKKEISQLPENQKMVLELGSSTGFSSVIYFAILLDLKVWGCEVNRFSYGNSLLLKEYMLGDKYQQNVKQFVDNFIQKNSLADLNSKVINREYLSNIGSKLVFNLTESNEKTLDLLKGYDWKSAISIIYAFCDGVSEQDMRWHIENIWNNIVSLRYIITTEPLASDMKLYNHGFNRKYS
jgi:hypothetical protein